MYFAPPRPRVVRRGVSISRRSPGKIALLALSVLGIGGCGASPEQPHAEVATRKQIPIPVCSQQLTPLKRAASGKASAFRLLRCVKRRCRPLRISTAMAKKTSRV